MGGYVGIIERKWKPQVPLKGYIGFYRGICGGYGGIMEKKMETTNQGLVFRVKGYSPP